MKQLILYLLLSLSLVGYAQSGDKNFIDQNYVEVVGTAELEIAPDMIYVRVELTDKDNKEKLPLAEIEKRMIESLSDIGVDTNNDLSLMDFISKLTTHWFSSNITLSKKYQLIVRDAATLQNAFYVFHRLGISNVSIIKLEHSQIEQYKKEVRVNAVKAAKEKAEMLVAALDQELGKALYIGDTGFASGRSIDDALRGQIAGLDVIGSSNYSVSLKKTSSLSDIEFEKIKIKAHVLVRFELK